MAKRGSQFGGGETWKTGSSARAERIRKYLEWVITDPSERQPSTKRDFAALLGVSFQTLQNYEKDLWFQREVDRQSRGLFKASRMPAVIDSLYRIATNTDHKNAVAAARALLDWQSKIVDGEAVDFSRLTNDELVELLESVEK